MGLQLSIGGPGANQESDSLAGLEVAYDNAVTLGQAEEIVIHMIRMAHRRRGGWVTRINAVGPDADNGLAIFCDHWCQSAWPVSPADDLAREAAPGYLYHFHVPKGTGSRQTNSELDELWELVHMATHTYPEMCSDNAIYRLKPFATA